jgi:hypothetical protein
MASYADWNEALWWHFFGVGAGGPVYLALDDDTIDELWHRTPALKGLGADAPAGAVDDFCRAVREDLVARGWLPDRPAHCLARCCLFVLAYSRVERREKPGAPAYWSQVRRLLGASEAAARGQLGPFGLDQSTFQELWARARDEFRIELPRTHLRSGRTWSGQLCNVEIVRAQAGLRQLDLCRVRAMFDECGGRRSLALSAGEEEVFAWIVERKNYLTPYAGRVLTRNPELAQRQVQREWQCHLSIPFERPSGTAQASTAVRGDPGQRSALSPLYLQLDAGRRSLVAYRGDVPIGGELLASELARLEDQVWTFDELYERYHAERSTTPGKRVILFRDERRLPGEQAALSELSSSFRCWRPAELDGLPAGWALVHCREIRRPPPTNAFSWVVPGFELRGGLPVGPGRWLVGAGPVVVAEGACEVEVDGETWSAEGGAADLSSLAPGDHEVRLGGRVERFEIVRGRRVTDLGDVASWIWPGGASWPEITTRGTAAMRWLDGAYFVEASSELRPIWMASASSFGFAWRRRPTSEDVRRAFSGGQGDTLALAAVARGRR